MLLVPTPFMNKESQFTLIFIAVATSALTKEILVQTVFANTKQSLPIWNSNIWSAELESQSNPVNLKVCVLSHQNQAEKTAYSNIQVDESGRHKCMFQSGQQLESVWETLMKIMKF